MTLTNTFNFQVYFLASEMVDPAWRFIAHKPAAIPVFLADRHASLKKATSDFNDAIEGAGTANERSRLCYATSVYKSRGRSFQEDCPQMYG